MKKAVLLGIFGLLLLACHTNIDWTAVPKDAQFCHSDWDCPTDYYCGFAAPDTPPVCRYSPGYSQY